MVISQEKAAVIATILCQKQKEYRDLLEKNFKSAVYDAYQKQTPQQVKNVAKNFPDWVKFAKSVHLDGHGFNRETFNVEKSVISNSGNYYCILNLTSTFAPSLKKKHNEWLKACEDYKKLLVEVKNALLALKTYARITEKFPEAAKHLPKTTVNALVINVDDVRNKLKQSAKVA
jgi:hypothetical protein